MLYSNGGIVMKKIVFFILSINLFVNYNIHTNLLIKKDLSKNFEIRKNQQGTIVKPQYIILHYTVNCNHKEIIEYFKNPFKIYFHNNFYSQYFY